MKKGGIRKVGVQLVIMAFGFVILASCFCDFWENLLSSALILIPHNLSVVTGPMLAE
jgi:hypothetical protein